MLRFRSGPLHGRSPSRSRDRSRGATVLAAVALLSSMLTILPAQVVLAAAPSAPVLNAPTNGATGQTTSPTLSVRVSDPDNNAMTVTFMGRPFASGNFAQIAQKTNVASGATTTTPWSNIGAGQKFEWFVTASDGTTTTTGPTWTFRTTAAADPVFVGVGDIAACTNTNDTDTGNVISGIDGTIFTVGDNVYPDGTAADFTNCYAPTPWGAAAQKSRTRPIPGNHDWNTGNLNGYTGYFGAMRHRRQREELLQLQHRRQQLARRQSGQRVRAGSRWLRRRVAPGAVAESRPPGESVQERHRPVAQAALQQRRDEPDRAPGVRRRPVRRRRRHRHGRPRSRLRADRPAQRDRDSRTRVGASATSRSAWAATATRASARRSPAARSATPPSYGIFKLTLHATSYDWKFLPVAGSTFTDSGTATVVPTVANAAPVAVADSYSTPPNTRPDRRARRASWPTTPTRTAIP